MSGFGQNNPFGQPASLFGSSQTSSGGQQPTAGSSPAFGQVQGGFAPSQTVSAPQTSVFGQSTFGTTSTTSSAFGTASAFGSGSGVGMMFANISQRNQPSAFATSSASSGSTLATTSSFGSTPVFGGGTGFGTKDSNASASGGFKPPFGGSTTTSTMFGGTSSKTVFGAQANSASGMFGFNTSTAVSTPSTNPLHFGTTLSSTTFPSQQTSAFGSSQNSATLFESTSVPSTVFGGARNDNTFVTNSGSGSQFGATTSVFGSKTTTSSETGNNSSNLFSSSNSSSNIPQVPTASSQASLIRPSSNIFGSSKMFGAGSNSNTGFAFKAEDNETGETKTSTSSVFGGAGFGKTSGFGGSSDQGAGGFGDKVKKEPISETGGSSGLFGKGRREEERAESDRGIKRGRDVEGTSRRGRSLFSSALAGVKPATIKTEAEATSSTSMSRARDQRRPEEESSEERKEGGLRKLRRMSSVTEDVSSKIALVCKGVPPRVNKGAILRKHFSKYGSVAKVFPNITKNSATIHFKDHRSAAEAKMRGRVLAKGLPAMQIFWSSHSPAGSKTAVAEPGTSGLSGDTRPRDDEGEVREPRRSRWRADDVQSELEGLAGTQDIQKALGKARTRTKDDSGSDASTNTAGLSPSHSASQTVRARGHSPGRASPTSSPVKTTGEKVSLSSLQNAVAKTVHEMKNVLEQRDKYIRESRTKQSDLATARAFVGTCMDMCPEKERYDREDKRRLSCYEWIPGTENIPGQNPRADHRRLVKEYSRSSADQEEPLSHELRPIPVLVRTMTYLLSEIADKGTEGKWMDWYGFLWDRTRGIRKDITQQQLFSVEAVELLEKCARFHIYCSERLCEEDMHVFDAKINNENLTKCLQTLKEMYHDLEMKQGVFCPHEAEFRAYVVLMNLNEGDTLREIQTLRPEVQNSSEIKYAVKVYTSLNSNNYVRFFRLVKQASYLSACIIHRYFTQVRTRALQVMMKAFGAKKSQLPFPELARMLSFESTSEAASFCSFYGLRVMDDSVLLDRSDFMVPEAAFCPLRAINLIESKWTASVGEAINGQPLPPLMLPEPQLSFDDNGRFRMSQEVLHYAKDRKQADIVAVEKKPSVTLPPAGTSTQQQEVTAAVDVTQKQTPVSNEIVKMIARELFWEVIDEFVLEISQSYVGAVQLYLEAGKKTVEEIVILGTAPLIRDVCTEVMEEATKVRQKELEAELEARKDRVAELMCQELLDEVTKQDSLNMATIEMRDVHAQLRREQEERSSKVVAEDLVQEVMTEMVLDVSREVHRVDVVQRREELEAISQSVQLYRAGRFLQVWKKEYAKRVKLKRAMLAFPCAPTSQKIDKQLKTLLPDRTQDSLVNRKMYVNREAMISLETPMEIEKREVFLHARYSLLSLYRQLMKEKAWRPLDLPNIVADDMRRAYLKQRGLDSSFTDATQEITWKLVVSLPDIAGLSSDDHIISTWLSRKLQRGNIPNHPNMKYKGEVLSLYHSSVDGKGKQPLKIGVCVRSVRGTLNKKEVAKVEEKRLLLGTCGIVFVLSRVEDVEEYWASATARLAGVLHAKPVFPALPLVLVVPERSDQNIPLSKLIYRMEIDSFQEDGLISAVYKMSVPTEEDAVEATLPEASDLLCGSIQWLAAHMPDPPELQRSRIRDYVEDFLMQEYFQPVLQDLRQKRQKHSLHQAPNTLITLYNCVVEHLAEVASSASLATHSCPISEFVWGNPQEDLPAAHWNSPEHLSLLYEEISLLQLPRFKYLDYNSNTWEQVCSDVWNFVKSVIKQNKGKHSVHLVTRIKSLLLKVQEDFEDVCYLVEREDRCEPTYVNMPWTDVLDACISYRMACLPILEVHSDDKPSRDLWVYYEEEELVDFVPPESWKDALLSTDAEDGTTVLETVREAVSKKQLTYSMSVQDKDQPDTSVEDDRPVLISMTHGYNDSEPENSLRVQCGSLLSSLQKEKKESEKFEKYLQSVMKGGAAASDLLLDDNKFHPQRVKDISNNASPQGHPFGDVAATPQRGPFPETPTKRHFLRDSCVDTPLNKRPCVPLDSGDYERYPGWYDDGFDDASYSSVENDQDVTITKKLDAFQEELLIHKRDSNLFEQKLKVWLNS